MKYNYNNNNKKVNAVFIHVKKCKMTGFHRVPYVLHALSHLFLACDTIAINKELKFL